MADIKQPWRCPRCRAAGHHHGRGPCKAGLQESTDCDGFLCLCEVMGFDGPEVKSNDHGQTETNPCRNSKCGHCGWSGIYPANGLEIVLGSLETPSAAPIDPSALSGWEKKAFEAGWKPPDNWTPTVTEEPMKCKLHPTYQAKGAPRIKTCDCIKIWEAKQKEKAT